MANWLATNNELPYIRLAGNDIDIPAGINKVYAYVTNDHEGELLIQLIKEKNFGGSLLLIDCINALGSSNKEMLAAMVSGGVLEEVLVLQPGCKIALSEEEKHGLNQDKHEQCLLGIVTSNYPKCNSKKACCEERSSYLCDDDGYPIKTPYW
jgi:hypothetical protein